MNATTKILMDTQPPMLDGRQAKATPTVSVIIPAYNVADFIVETLDSVLSQTMKDYEIIVINDGSPDSDQLERALEPYRDHILYIKQENRGAGAARNAGLRIASGRFVAFLDGDDIWYPNFLDEQLRLIQGDGGYDIVYADAMRFGDPVSAGHTTMEESPSDGEVTFESLIGGRCSVITSAVVARRDPILEVGLFDETFPNCQDFDLWLRLVKDANARITYQRKPLVWRRIYQGSLASDPLKSLDGQLRVLDKVGARNDLTADERATLERTIILCKATVNVIEGKASLLNGDFGSASKSFRFANANLRSWKLRLMLVWLRIAPGSLQRFYRSRST